MTTTISPSLGHGVLVTQAGVGATPGYDAIDVRRLALAPPGEGVQSYESFRVRQRGAGANMSVDIGMDLEAFVRGDAVTLQSIYTVAPHSATINETITAAHATLPRLDQVVLEVKDTTHDASGSSLAQTRVVAGTATSGATLDNRTGAAALPDSALLLADVIVAAADSSIIDAEIRDRRAFTTGIPPVKTDIDQVALIPIHTVYQFGQNAGAPTSPLPLHVNHDLMQVAALVYLPRRIAAATRIRWNYNQSASVLTGNYVFGIYGSDGRKIVDTGSVALTTGYQARSETITATTFEPGMYYVLFGLDATSGAGTNAWTNGVKVTLAANDSPGPFCPNLGLHSASGGVTAPTTILGFTDCNGGTISNAPVVPLVSLSVG